MKSLVYIDACMRKDSSTRRIAKPIISQLSERYTITKFVLNELPLEIVKEDRMMLAYKQDQSKRENLHQWYNRKRMIQRQRKAKENGK